ncbi:uncharacterized protein LOC108140651 [Drosophila elegans]|uniref:uncharacterized protein LOC108140651 n=1 Tax=Drosophila elegans TaxID=30023 RepID=UPI0007E7C71E|nr:uncharacterized protein LOC108140651 [Drosophila elegans]
MCTGNQYLELVSLFAQAKPQKPRVLRPCHQHELLLQLICRRKEQLTKSQLEDLIWNMSNGPKKRTSKSRRRQSGGMDGKIEPTDAEVVFGCCEKSPPGSISHRGWGRSRIEWLRKLEVQQKQYYQAWQETPGVNDSNKASRTNRTNRTNSKKDKEASGPKDKDKSKARRNLPGCWALLPFSCGWHLGHDSSCQDVPNRKKSS